MNRTLMVLTVLLASLTLALAARSPANDSAVIRQQVDALLKLRRKPEPLPVDPPNPFVQAVTGTATTAAGLEAVPAKDAEAGGDADPAELLARFASRLRITGIIQLKDQLHIIINDSPWKEGDYLIVDRTGGRIVRLQVIRIQPGQLTLRFGEAELMLRF